MLQHDVFDAPSSHSSSSCSLHHSTCSNMMMEQSSVQQAVCMLRIQWMVDSDSAHAFASRLIDGVHYPACATHSTHIITAWLHQNAARLHR